MRVLRLIVLCIITVFGFASCGTINRVWQKKDLSPNDFGLAKAKTGIERYDVLLRTHQAAVAAGVNVNYRGIDTIRLEIPSKPSQIPLTQYNDFEGCVFVVKNTSKVCYLFGRWNEGMPITVDKRLIDNGDFRSVDALKRGRYLLVIEDKNLWVAQRKGHNYGHSRKDILLVENGVAKNSTVMPYNNVYSNPKCCYMTLGKEPLVIKNISIVRDPGCTYLTHVANIAGADDVRFENVIIKTPESPLTDDRGIRIYNCTNVKMDHVRIEGTYSHSDHSGYGVFLNNVWNYTATNMYGKANWGIFGNNNVNVAKIENSRINRFDIHCYGRDISFKNVAFFDHYNQYSSVYGTISYDHCSFTNFTPVLNGGSYYSFVGHKVIFNDCVFNATPQKCSLIALKGMNAAPDMRPELTEKCLPDVSIKNLMVNMRGGADELLLFKCFSGGKRLTDIGFVSKVDINGLTINSDGETVVKGVTLSNIIVQTKKDVDCRMRNVTINQPHKEGLSGYIMNTATLKTNIPIKGGSVKMKNVKNLKQ